jgi:hypothetical protein
MRNLALVLLALLLLLLPVGIVKAQTYSFSLDQEIVHVYWNGDGTATIEYTFVFTNDTGVSPIDFVDVGVPNSNYDLSTITADVNGQPITNIEPSPYVKPGVALGLGNNAIPPGQSGTVHVVIKTVREVLYADTSGDNYASAVFSPTWFGDEFVHGSTDLTVVFHLPPDVQPDEPRWHEAPSGWMAQPITGIDEEGRITYTWRKPDANGYTQYMFGASFPVQYIPADTITEDTNATPSFWSFLGVAISNFLPCACFCGVFGLVIATFAAGIRSNQRRKLKYLPPKVAIEGHGIKRGLTAVEAAILMEQPMDKILTMILFAVIKKNAAAVKTQDPLDIEVFKPIPEDLHQYEIQFLEAFGEDSKRKRQRALQEMIVHLIKSVGKKMKGFSHKETVAYYKNIVQRAWKQVEAAETPEVKSEKYDEVMEWTMLDKEYEDRTREVFHTGPVFVPMWWPRYDPGYSGPKVSPRTVPAPTQRGATPSMPTLPGAAFAGSVVTGVQNMSSSVVGNLTNFTSRITNQTNPVPKTSSSYSGGGCACACACAGCACACAGGGR